MVNVGLGLVSSPSTSSGQHAPCLLDPFCGTGRILMEAVLLGAEVLGADIDQEAVRASQVNLRWLAAEYHVDDASDRVLRSEVGRLPTLLSPDSVDVMVTEPFLGPPQHRTLAGREVDELFAQVRPGYEQLLQAGQKLLTDRGAMVVVFPVVGARSLIDAMIDRVQYFGYHVQDSIRVSREDQFISRDIVMLSRIADRKL